MRYVNCIANHKVLKRKGDGKKAPFAILGTNGKDELVVYSGKKKFPELK